MRCFIALDLPAPLRNYLAKLSRDSFKMGKVRWVEADQLHVTLVFAGEVGEATVTALREAVEQAEVGPMNFSLTGLGTFPPTGEPHVVWAGITGDVAPLGALQKQLTAIADGLGIERDKRKWKPHITLGRVKSPFGAYALIDQLKKVAPTLRDKPFPATAITLYASDLSPRGPLYRTLLRRPLE